VLLAPVLSPKIPVLESRTLQTCVGERDGTAVGLAEGDQVGTEEGVAVGDDVGDREGPCDGISDTLGTSDGALERDGVVVGATGLSVGDGVGTGVGASVSVSIFFSRASE